MTKEFISRSHMPRRNRIDNFHQSAFSLCTNIECWLLTLSDSYTVDEMLLRWKRFIPVQINDELELPQFILVAIATTQCSQSYVTGEWLWPLWPSTLTLELSVIPVHYYWVLYGYNLCCYCHLRLVSQKYHKEVLLFLDLSRNLGQQYIFSIHSFLHITVYLLRLHEVILHFMSSMISMFSLIIFNNIFITSFPLGLEKWQGIFQSDKS